MVKNEPIAPGAGTAYKKEINNTPLLPRLAQIRGS